MPFTPKNSFTFYSLQLFIFFTVIVAACCFIGIASRPLSFLAFFWPANSVFLALLIRFPRTRKLSSFVGAYLGYVFADLSRGTSLDLTLVLTTANFLYVLTSFSLYIYFRKYIHTVHRSYSYLFLFGLASIGSLVGALFAATVVPMFNTRFMLGPFWTEFGYWFTAELQNALLLLPIVLNFPKPIPVKPFLAQRQQAIRFIDALPLFAVILSTFASYYDSGPGSLLYPIAALIWCAIRYPHILVALITSLTSAIVIYHVSDHYLLLYPDSYLHNTISIRLGLIMMTIAPLTVSSISSANTRLIQKLQHAIAHDELTSSLTRRQFLQSVRLLHNKVQKATTTSPPSSSTTGCSSIRTPARSRRRR